jgi:hypothetical protein
MGTRSLTRVIETWKDDDGKQKQEMLVTMARSGAGRVFKFRQGCKRLRHG